MKKEHAALMAVLIAALAIGVLMPHAALASTSSGTEFSSLYQKVVGWINGIPGIMGAIALLIGGLYMSFVGGKSPMYFFYSAIAAAAIFLVPNIAVSLGGAVW